MPSKIERLQFIRKRLSADIKRQHTTVNTYNEETSTAVIVSRREALEELWFEFKTNNEAIEASKESPCSDDFITENAIIHELYLEAQATLISLTPEDTTLHRTITMFRPDRDRNHTVQEVQTEPENTNTTANTSTSNNEANGIGNPQVTSTPSQRTTGLPATIKLPPIQIKPFTGDKVEWPEFKASCESTFTSIMDEVNRFRYLKSHLQGEPARMIKHLPMGNESYVKAWEILKNRYDNERAIINANLKRLFDLPFLKNESVDSLKTMLDITNECIAAITSYNFDTSSWYPILIFLLTQRLDIHSVQHWEEKIQGQKTVPEFKEFLKFLDIRINILETTEASRLSMAQSGSYYQHVQNNQNKVKQKIMLTTEKMIKCLICSEEHRTFKCPQFLNKTVDERKQLIQERNLCFNCLYSHETDKCMSKFSCRICGNRHHSLLHSSVNVLNMNIEQKIETMEPDEQQAFEMEMFTGHLNQNESNSQVILATAMICIEYQNKVMLCRALIDQGSMTNLISKRACEALSLPQYNVSVPITGVGGTVTCQITKKTQFSMSSYYDNKEKIITNALILPRITTLNLVAHNNNWKHLNGLQLADPKLDSNGRIDVLIGAATFSEILLDGVIKGSIDQPIAQKTKLGWILSGKTNFGHTPIVPIFSIIVSDESLSNMLQKFWESEEIPQTKQLTAEEQLAEEIYKKTTKRCDDGRYMVKLPFKSSPTVNLGESFTIAQRRYLAIQRRFKFKPEFQIKYDKCIQEYLDLDQMELVCRNEEYNCYLPHHPVIKDSSSTTKIRPVFDASCKTSNGKSLNDELLIGPTIQPDLFSLLIHWRKYQFAITGDIEKMYRQIWVDPIDSNYQLILWQSPQSNEIKSYRLKTVTFGIASAPFLAIRTLFQIGKDIEHHSIDLAKKIQDQFYVDDFLDSSPSINEAKQTINDITAEMLKYGMKLRKWKSNESSIINELPLTEKEEGENKFSTFKTLGIQWQPSSDKFIFLPAELNNKNQWTKRTILADISKLFDPLGWLSPCIILAKIFMQNLWLLPLDWDNEIPKKMVNEWVKIRNQFVTSCEIKIPRWIGLKNEIKNVSLQGFSDASEKSCACVIYIRIENMDSSIVCNIIAAKTKVAPIKKISIPRLELNAALLLTKLLKKVEQAIKIPNIEQKAWTDSTIVLCWLASHPNRWKTYVANRVTEIQCSLPSKHWSHIESKNNPADCASRGLIRTELESFSLWWQGPTFLSQDKNQWPDTKNHHFNEKAPEERKAQNIVSLIEIQSNPIINRFSNYARMLRVIAYCLQWLKIIRLKKAVDTQEFLMANNVTTIHNIEIRLIKIVQEESFLEIKQLKDHKAIKPKSSIKNLDPFLDENQTLRVGGRIHQSSLTRNEKHPIILPAKHHFSKILIQYTHEQTLHGGLAITLQKLRQKFWIINGKKSVNSVIHKCITCFRYKKKLLTQKMGNLPSYRLEETLPFTFTGVDYAGYFEVKSSSRKNAPYVKCYISLFICLTTRAIHLELVSNLKTEQFLQAFKRFISRRGIPKEMFSDNGTNFVGAAKEIQSTLNQALNQQNNTLNKWLHEKRIKWSNIPARAPHFGGWESGVKLIKHHLKRVLKGTRLTFEDFNTLIIEIEAVVNSRPLWSIPSNVDEYEALTPGHFLTFKALNTLPEPDLSHIPTNRLNQYQYLRRLLTDFWRLWSKEYIQQLQIRKKWMTTEPNVRINQIVLVAEDHEQPTYWSLGKIIKTMPGKDGLVRVADVWTNKNILRRPIHKLSLLPIIDNQVKK